MTKPWGPPILSVIVTAGFFVTVFLFLVRPIEMTDTAWTALNILLGTLASQFANIVQFNIGSSLSSKTKDETIKSLAEKP